MTAKGYRCEKHNMQVLFETNAAHDEAADRILVVAAERHVAAHGPCQPEPFTVEV